MSKRAIVLSVVTILALAVADTLSARFGPAVSVFNALALIGLIITTRDALHDEWQGKARVLGLGVIIVAGGLVAWGVSVLFATAPPEIAAKIALGSGLAWAIAAIVDTLTYQGLHNHPWVVRANGSNIPAALADSVVFAWIAFGDPLGVGLPQFFAKVVGGLLWVYVIGKVRGAATSDPRRQDAFAV
jgi:queuosine precursor transporter